MKPKSMGAFLISSHVLAYDHIERGGVMPRRTHIETHMSLEELEKKLKGTREAVAKQQLRVIVLLMKGMTQKEVAVRCSYSAAWVHTIVQRYNESGIEALRDHRRDNPGRPYRLSVDIRKEIKDLISRPPQDGGLWTGPRLVEWVRTRTGDDSIDSKRGWEWLRQLGCKDRIKRKSKNKKRNVKKSNSSSMTPMSHTHKQKSITAAS